MGEKLRSFGSGPGGIWFMDSSDGYEWTTGTRSLLKGGDSTVFKTKTGKYGMVFVGPPCKDASVPPYENFLRPVKQNAPSEREKK